jgi:HD-GYP domain-containing protein (c-di-GMP phosphodiesterase class II)
MLTGMTNSSDRILSAAEAGIEGGHGVVLVHPVVYGGEIVGALFAGDKHGDDRQISNADIKLLETTAGYFDVLLDNAFLYEDQRRNFLGTLEALTSSIDAKDPYTCGHSERVAALAGALARAHGLGQDEAERVRIGGLVHDIGKIGVAESVLCKSGRLTDDEFEQIKRHPRIGYEILKDIPSLEDVLKGVLWHHERWDGRGYPDGMRGSELPLIARIIGLVDAFDAMSSNRTYRDAMGRERVLKEIKECAGSQFDPELAETFLGMDLAFYDRLLAQHVRRTAA